MSVVITAFAFFALIVHSHREFKRGYLLGLQHTEEEIIRGNDPREVIKMLREER